MRTLLLIAASLIACLLAFIAWYLWDSSRNRGSEFGYYGGFNRVSNALASVPGVKITNYWHNLDVSLEEFAFELTISNRPVRLFFGETDPVRAVPREAAITALQARISAELALAAPATNR